MDESWILISRNVCAGMMGRMKGLPGNKLSDVFNHLILDFIEAIMREAIARVIPDRRPPLRYDDFHFGRVGQLVFQFRRPRWRRVFTPVLPVYQDQDGSRNLVQF